jgi:hypothetical protein
VNFTVRSHDLRWGGVVVKKALDAQCFGPCVGHQVCLESADEKKISMLIIEIRFLGSPGGSLLMILVEISCFLVFTYDLNTKT